MRIRTAADVVGKENLVDAIQGHWAIGEGRCCDGVSISDDEIVFWTYPGEYGLTGYIKDIAQCGDEFEITVYYPAADHMGYYYPEHESRLSIGSDDDFLKTLIINGTEFNYIGMPSANLSEACEQYLNN
jgi:hypothetical protein